jgi:hypothetical protein
MIGFTPAEFNQVREAIAAAHLYCQAISPLLKARHTMMNKDQRQLAQFAPQAVAEGFNTIALITHRENRDPDAVDARPAIKLQDIDTEAMRDELENVSALVLPDLVYQMVCALGELPMYHELITTEPLTTHRAAMLMAWTFEAGRRYGLQQALAIIDTTTTEFKTGTDAVLTAALNATLDLPSPELPFKPRSESPDGAAPSTIGANGEERSPGAAGESGQHTGTEIIPFEYSTAKQVTADLERVKELSQEQAEKHSNKPTVN